MVYEESCDIIQTCHNRQIDVVFLVFGRILYCHSEMPRKYVSDFYYKMISTWKLMIHIILIPLVYSIHLNIQSMLVIKLNIVKSHVFPCAERINVSQWQKKNDLSAITSSRD